MKGESVLEGRIRDEVRVSEIPVADFDVVAGFAGLLRRNETSAGSLQLAGRTVMSLVYHPELGLGEITR